MEQCHALAVLTQTNLVDVCLKDGNRNLGILLESNTYYSVLQTSRYVLIRRHHFLGSPSWLFRTISLRYLIGFHGKFTMTLVCISSKLAPLNQIFSSPLCFISTLRPIEPPLWSSGQSSWLQIQRSRVRFSALLDILSSSGSGTGSTQPREENCGTTWMKK
jgi:hypothetical protein